MAWKILLDSTLHLTRSHPIVLTLPKRRHRRSPWRIWSTAAGCAEHMVAADADRMNTAAVLGTQFDAEAATARARACCHNAAVACAALVAAKTAQAVRIRSARVDCEGHPATQNSSLMSHWSTDGPALDAWRMAPAACGLRDRPRSTVAAPAHPGCRPLLLASTVPAVGGLSGPGAREVSA